VTVNGVKSVCPFGFRIDTLDEVIVTFVNFRLMRWFAAPVNVPVAVFPEVEIDTVTEDPPVVGVIVKFAASAAGMTRHAATAAIAATKAQRVDERRPTLV
jgi:hypothetical protein